MNPAFVNLGSDSDCITHVRANTNPTHRTTSTCPTHATSITLGIKRKDHQYSCLLLNPMIKTTR
jgi:hypothetical protein